MKKILFLLCAFLICIPVFASEPPSLPSTVAPSVYPVPSTLEEVSPGVWVVKGTDGRNYQLTKPSDNGEVEILDSIYPLDIATDIFIDEYNKRADEIVEQNKKQYEDTLGIVDIPKEYHLPSSSDVPSFANGRLGTGYSYIFVKQYVDDDYNLTLVQVDPSAFSVENWSTKSSDPSYISDYVSLHGVISCKVIERHTDDGNCFVSYYLGHENSVIIKASKHAYANFHAEFYTNSPSVYPSLTSSVSSLGSNVEYFTDEPTIENEAELDVIPYDGGYSIKGQNVKVINFDELVSKLKAAGFTGYINPKIDAIDPPGTGDGSAELPGLDKIDYFGEEKEDDSFIVKIFKAVAKFLKSLIVPDDVTLSDGSKVSYLQNRVDGFNTQIHEKMPLIEQCGSLCDSFLSASSYDDVQPSFEIEYEGQTVSFIDFSFFSKYRSWLHDIILFCAWFRFVFKLPRRLQAIVSGHYYSS